MLSRRDFHSVLLASAALSLVPDVTQAAAGSWASADDIFLNRLTFGTGAAHRVRLGDMGREAWLAAQLSPPAADPALDARLSAARLRHIYEAGDDGAGHSWAALDELKPLSALNADPATLVPLLDFSTPMDYSHRSRPAEEVIAASLIRAVHGEAQLNEVMTQFWHDHFNVASTKYEGTAVFFASYDAMLRANALGNFRTMLGEVTKSPSMLNYLGNADSRASPANENFARELLELYTLGAGNYLQSQTTDWRAVPGALDGLASGYIDADVFEVARAFTGWTIGDGRWIAEGVNAPVTGRFHYAEAWHDPYQKRILGREFAPNRAAMADGEDVLDMLATHPATARFVCTKIARRFVADDPPEALVTRMAERFRATAGAPDQIAQVLRLMVEAPEFAEAPPAKLRRPFEFLAALMRASGAEVVSPDAAFRWELMRAGWMQHEFPPPTGHPDRADRWLNTTVLARMVDLALYAHEPWAGMTTTDLGAALPAGAQTFGGVVTHWGAALGTDAAAARQAFLDGIGVAGDDALPIDPEERHGLSALAFAFAALGPSTMLR